MKNWLQSLRKGGEHLAVPLGNFFSIESACSTSQCATSSNCPDLGDTYCTIGMFRHIRWMELLTLNSKSNKIADPTHIRAGNGVQKLGKYDSRAWIASKCAIS